MRVLLGVVLAAVIVALALAGAWPILGVVLFALAALGVALAVNRWQSDRDAAAKGGS